VDCHLRDCLKILRGAAARDFGCGQGGEVRASPQRAVRTEPTQSTGKRPAARRVFAQKVLWLRCSSVAERRWLCSFVAPRHRAFCTKTAPLIIFRQSLRADASESTNNNCKPPPASARFIGQVWNVVPQQVVQTGSKTRIGDSQTEKRYARRFLKSRGSSKPAKVS